MVCPFLVIVAETRAWNLIFLSNYWIDLNEKKPGFFSYLFKCFPMLLPAFTIASYRWTFYYTYQYLFFVRAHDWVKDQSCQLKKGRVSGSKTHSIKVSATPFLPASFLYEPRRQNHDIIQFGDTIILQACTLKPTSYLPINLLKFNLLLISSKSIC